MDGNARRPTDPDPADLQTPAAWSGHIAGLDGERAAAEAELVEVIAKRRALAAIDHAGDRAAAAQSAAQIGWLNERHLAILAAESLEKGSRDFWRQQVDALGRHLAPDLPRTHQVARALDDERGHAFVTALQSRLA